MSPPVQTEEGRSEPSRLAVAVSSLSSNESAVLTVYFTAIVLSELLLALGRPYLSLGAHLVLLVALPVHAATVSGGLSRFLLALTFAPLIRVISLALPLAAVPTVSAYALASVPLFVAIVYTTRMLGQTRRQLGLTGRGLPSQLAIAALGVPFGVAEYWVLRPEAVAPLDAPLAAAWATIVLFVSTGLMEELIFRGSLHLTAYELRGYEGLILVNVIFAALHIGYQSPMDVAVVLAIGMVFSWCRQRTGSIVGVTIAHGMTNTLLFVVLPARWPLP